MPVVFRDGSLVFFFYSNEGLEPVHIHVRKGGNAPDAWGKWWLDTKEAAFAAGFSSSELRRIRANIVEREQEIREAWERHFG